MMIEAVHFADHAVPAVVGIESNGKKHVSATELDARTAIELIGCFGSCGRAGGRNGAKAFGR